jgi:hypothetical protein
MIRQTAGYLLVVWRIINGQNIDFRPELLGKRKISAALISQSDWGRQLTAWCGVVVGRRFSKFSTFSFGQE